MIISCASEKQTGMFVLAGMTVRKCVSPYPCNSSSLDMAYTEKCPAGIVIHTSGAVLAISDSVQRLP